MVQSGKGCGCGWVCPRFLPAWAGWCALGEGCRVQPNPVIAGSPERHWRSIDYETARVACQRLLSDDHYQRVEYSFMLARALRGQRPGTRGEPLSGLDSAGG